MENKMYQDELEQFLQDETKDHRMYPSDHIWRNIQSEVHGHQTWPALTFISLFIISALTVSTLLINHPAQKLAKLSFFKNLENKKIPSAETQESLSDFNSISTEQVTAKTIAGIEQQRIEEERAMAVEAPVIQMRFTKADPIIINAHKAQKFQLPNKPSFTNNDPKASTEIALQPAVTENSNNLTEASEPIVALSENVENKITTPENKVAENTLIDQPIVAAKIEANSADDYLKEFAYKPVTTLTAKNSKFGFGFFITPSTSYRKLSDSKAKEILGAAPANAPVGLNYTSNINEIVRHKPAVGLELGFAVLYNMTNRLKFKTGIQFNIRQYYIETFQAITDLTTISLVNNRGVENITLLSPYNNNNGYRSTELDNKMYQVSIPIGFQYDLIKGQHVGITAEASIQPTFTLNKSLYLLSTDYKHYADGSSLMRKWNINSAFGINITYKTGVYQWYLGPQARFQHLPTYSNKYPITEYLMDYGIRLGFIKQLK